MAGRFGLFLDAVGDTFRETGQQPRVSGDNRAIVKSLVTGFGRSRAPERRPGIVVFEFRRVWVARGGAMECLFCGGAGDFPAGGN